MGKCDFGACWSCFTPALLVPQIKLFFFYEITFVQEINTVCEVNKHIMHVSSHTHTTHTKTDHSAFKSCVKGTCSYVVILL